jgi:hypothetical protein
VTRPKKLIVLTSLVVVTMAGVWALGHYELVLTIKRAVPVRVLGTPKVRVLLDSTIDATLDDEMPASVRLGTLQVPIHETLVVPLEMKLAVPIDAEIDIDQPLDIALTVPIHTVLTERELDMSKLELPLDTDMFVDDVLDLNFVVPLDTKVSTTLGLVVPVKGQLPIRARVPIHQKVHIRDRLSLAFTQLKIPLNVSIPIHATLPFKQTVRVRGMIDVPIHQRLAIPIHQVLHPDLNQPIPVTVALHGKVHAALKSAIETRVQLPDALPTQLGQIHVSADGVSIAERAAP